MLPHVLAVVALLPLQPQRADTTSIVTSVAQLADRYSLEIVAADWAFPVPTPHGPIDGTPAADSDVERYSVLLVEEFSLYPPAFVSRTGLKRIVLCTELSFAGQRRNAVPHFQADTLYLDVVRGLHSRPYMRKVIHHEFFHIVDLRDDGQLYADDDWRALNPPDFRYGTGGRNAQELRSTSVLTDQYPGFLNHYSTTAVEEDKAEVFANLMVDPVYVRNRATEDPVLRAKVERMKQILARFSPELTDVFWQRVDRAERSDP